MELLENGNDEPDAGDADTEPDEDSGGEKIVTIANLPGSQLRAPAIQEDNEDNNSGAGQNQTSTTARAKRSKKKIRHWTKVRPLLDIVNRNFLRYGTVFGPTELSIDESIM